MFELKLLHFSDLHFSPARVKECFLILDFVFEQAIIHEVHAIVFSGDMFEKTLLNCDAHYLPRLKNKLLDIAELKPFIMIYGTDYHDAPGSLNIFKDHDRGLYLVEPEKPRFIVFDHRIYLENIIFYGIPDKKPMPDKNKKISAQESNKYLDKLCNFYSAHRIENQKNYAVVIGHGVVKNNQAFDEKYKSDIFLTENQLEQINANAYLFGHIHTPHTFLAGKGCYAGSFAQNWKELDYHPQINIITINRAETKIEGIRIPFLSKRIKSEKLIFEKGDTIWFIKQSADPITKEDLIKAGAHQNSLVTVKQEKRIAIRKKGIENILLYRNLYKEYYSDATEKELIIADELQAFEKNLYNTEKKEISFQCAIISGLLPLHDNLQINNFIIDGTGCQGIIGLIGRGGIGKSSILNCLSPFNVPIGQNSSLQSLFIDGNIEQNWLINHNKITLVRSFFKDKTVYAVYINEEYQEQHSINKEAYDAFVICEFGSPRIFALNVFQSQFSCYTNYEGFPINPDIFTVSNSELKRIIIDLTNCSKAAAHEYCKKQKKEFEKSFNEKHFRFNNTEKKYKINNFSLEKNKALLESLKSKDEKQRYFFNKLEKIINNLNIKIERIEEQISNSDYHITNTFIFIKENLKECPHCKKTISPSLAETSKAFLEQFVKIKNQRKKQLAINKTKFKKYSLKAEYESQDLFAYDENIKNLEYQIIFGEIAEIEKNLWLWERQEKAWHHDGIPAMILENFATEIDQLTNDILDKYYPGLQIVTETLKGNREYYHINVYNEQSGRIYLFSGLSGEERNFANVALRAACKVIYERTANIFYNLLINDESDNAVSEEKLSDFWKMKKELLSENCLNICVSHSPNSKQAFDSIIDLENYKE